MPHSTVTTGNVFRITLATGAKAFEGTAISSETRLNKDPSVKRIKPLKPLLMRSGTARKVSWLHRQSGAGSIVEEPSRTYVYVGPESYWTSCYGVSYPGTIDLGFNGLDSRLRSKIKSQNVNLAQTVAEYRGACSLFNQISSDIHRFVRELKRGYPLSAIMALIRNPRTKLDRELANRWLAYQYGLKPLVSDLYGLTAECSKGLSDGMQMRVSSTVKQRYAAQLTRTSLGHKYTIDVTVEVSIRGKAIYTIRRADLKTVTQLGFTNPALLAWELIPYSFVVDWMFPIGNYLSSLDALNGVSDLTVSRGISFLKTASARSVKEVEGYKERFAPTYSLSLPNLTYKPSSSLTAVLNGLALLKQLR